MMPLTSVSAVGLVSGFVLNRADSGFGGCRWLNHPDPAAHANHYSQKSISTSYFLSTLNPSSTLTTYALPPAAFMAVATAAA